MSDKYLTISEYAERVRITRQAAYERVKRNLVAAEFVRGQWMIRESQIKAIIPPPGWRKGKARKVD